MASRASIESGRGHVTLGVDDGPLRAGLAAAQAKFQSWGKGIMALGAGIASAGLALAAPLTLAISQFIPYEQALADMRAISGQTVEEMGPLKDKIEALALATGTSPTEIAQGFTELLRAGRSVDEILGGLGETALMFSRVAGMEMGESVTALSDALNVFRREGLSAAQMADIIVSAADASSISVRDVSQSFNSGASALAQYGQTALDTATAIAILGNSGVKAEMAGTGLKTFFMRLAGVTEDGTNDASDAIHELGFAFRDTVTGEFLPLQQIISNLNQSLQGRSKEDRDRLIGKLAGARGILALNPLLAAANVTEGEAGSWGHMRRQMNEALPTAEKFAIIMNTLGNQLKRMWVAITLVGIAIGEALAPKLRVLLDIATPIVGAVRAWVKANGELVNQIDSVLTGVIGTGLGIMAFGAIVYATSFVIGLVGSVLGVLYWSLSTVAGGFGLVSLAIGVTKVAIGMLTAGFGLFAVWGWAAWTVSAAWTAILWLGSAALATWNALVLAAAAGFGVYAAWSFIVSAATSLMEGIIWAGVVAMLAWDALVLGDTVSMIALNGVMLTGGITWMLLEGVILTCGIALLAWDAAVWAAAIAIAVIEAVIWTAAAATVAWDFLIANSFGLMAAWNAILIIGKIVLLAYNFAMNLAFLAVVLWNVGILNTIFSLLLEIQTIILAKIAVWAYTAALIVAWIWENLATAGIWLLVSAAVALIIVLGAVAWGVLLAALALMGLAYVVAPIVAAWMTLIAVALTTVNEIGKAFSGIGDALGASFESGVEIAMQAWGTLFAAIKGGQWVLAFEVIKVAALGMWAELKFSGIKIFYALADGIVDALSAAWREVRAQWVIMWADIEAKKLEAQATALALLPGTGERVAALRQQAAAVRAGGELDARRIRIGADQTLEQRQAAEAERLRRELRNAANQQERDDAVRNAQQRLGQLADEQLAGGQLGGAALGALAMAFITPMQAGQFGPGAFRPPQTPDTVNPLAGKVLNLGTFSRDAAAQFLGAMAVSGETRQEAMAREQRDLAREQRDLLRDMARRRGLVMN